MMPFLILSITDDDDREFMTRLYIDYRALMRKHARVILQNSHDIDDVINDTCVKLIDKVGLLQTMDCCVLSSYIVYTVRGVSIDFIKHRNVVSKHTYFGDEDDAAASISDMGDSFDLAQFVADKTAAQSVVEKLHQLPNHEREILTCKYVLDMKDNEIAKRMGIQPQSVRQYLTRARRHAAELLTKEGVEGVTNI